MSVEQTIAERQVTYGSFADNATVAQELKAVLALSPARLSNAQLEALDQICSKLSRIVSGDPNYIDSWRDISGYCNRVIEILEKTPGAIDVKVERVIIK